jgi:hypothetical protein
MPQNDVCGPLISDCMQDKEKPMAVRASNIMAARGMYLLMDSDGHLLTLT